MNEARIQDGQRFALLKLMNNFTNQRNCRLWILSQLLGKQVHSTKHLLLQDWRMIRNQAYLNWPVGIWEISETFKKKIEQLNEQYEEEILGQKKLW